MPTTTESITLSFQGVNFRLDPDKVGSELSYLQGNGDDVVLKLVNFTGALVVCPSPPSISQLATVEQDVDSQQTTRASNKISPRQQQQDTSGTSKKRSVSENNKSTTSGTRTSDAPRVSLDGSEGPAPASKKSRTSNDDEEAPSTMGQLSEPSQDEDMAAVLGTTQADSIAEVPTQGDDDDDDDGDVSMTSSPPNNNDDDIEEVEETVDTASSSAPPTESLAISRPLPLPRWGHSCTRIDGQRLLVYGGQGLEDGSLKTFQGLHVYDLATKKWSTPVNCEGVPRQWHSATYLPERQLLICFGGEAPNKKKTAMQVTDIVMCLDTEIMLFYPPSVSGQVPSGRSGHSAALLPNALELLIFGGVKGNKWLNSVSVLDVLRWKWSVPKIGGDAPRPRSYHSATPISKGNNKSWLVIFGGNDSVQSFNTVHVIETDGKNWNWINPLVAGDVPAARTGHCAALLEDNKTILIYGGWDPNTDDETAEDPIFDDSHLLDTSTWTWTRGPKPKYVEGEGPHCGAQRVGHTAALVPREDGSSEVLVFGGRVPNDDKPFANDFLSLQVHEKVIGLGQT